MMSHMRKRKKPPGMEAPTDERAPSIEPYSIASSAYAADRFQRGGDENDHINNGGCTHGDSPVEDLWDETIHGYFVRAIFEEGLKQASPAVIMEHMSLIDEKTGVIVPSPSATIIDREKITSERVKSRLQKYRKKADKSREDFISEYNEWLKFANESVVPVAKASGLHHDFFQLAHNMVKNNILCKNGVLLGGDMAAFLSFVDQREGALAQHHMRHGVKLPARTRIHQASLPSAHSRIQTLPSAREFSQQLSNGASLRMPLLTTEEEESHLGKSLQHVAMLFQSVSRLLMARRTVLTEETVVSPPEPAAKTFDAVEKLHQTVRDVDSDTSCLSEFP